MLSELFPRKDGDQIYIKKINLYYLKQQKLKVSYNNTSLHTFSCHDSKITQSFHGKELAFNYLLYLF